MQFNQPIPRATQPRFNEGSAMRSVRDTDANSQAWKKSSSTKKQSEDYGRALSSIQQQLNKLKRRQIGYTPFTDPFHPFKIYQPTNISSFTTGVLFTGVDGESVSCNIDSTIPTDFSASPPTVNPTTDGWRFWSVRSGEIELRPIYGVITNYSNNWTYQYPVTENSDGISPFDFTRTPVFVPPSLASYADYDDPTTETVLPPLIIGPNGGGADGPGGLYQFCFWVRIIPDVDSTNPPTARIEARDCSLYAGNLPSLNVSNLIPIGIVTSNGGFGIPLLIDQMVFDHIRNRFPANAGTYASGSYVNFRGTWDKDMPIFDPPDLNLQVFYPGDSVVVKSGGITAQFLMGGNIPAVWNDPFGAGADHWKTMWEINQ